MEEKLLFGDRNEFRSWLSVNHARESGIWLVFGKEGGVKSVKPDEALEEALCFGWIDGQIKRVNGETYLKKFTPRRKGSRWSKKNRDLAEEFLRNGKMTGYGARAVERAKENGTWDAGERVPVSEEQIGILAKALEGSQPASANFSKMAPSVRRTYTAFYLDAKKEETRARRLAGIIRRLNDNLPPM